MNTIPEGDASGSVDPIQPLTGQDTTISRDDPAQAEWEGSAPDSADASDPATATGADPAELSADDDDIPAEDLPGSAAQPESQGEDPLIAELGEEGQGDLAPEDA